MTSNSKHWTQQATANSDRLDQEISALESRRDGQQYRDFWSYAKQISELFKSLQPLRREDRERLWGRFSTLCSSTKEQQAVTSEKRKMGSREKRAIIEGKIHDAYYAAKGSSSGEELSRARSLLAEALAWMKNGWAGFNMQTEFVQEAVFGNEGRLLREDREACWERWKEVNDAIQSRRQELYYLNYTQLREEAGDALHEASCGNPHEALSKVKSTQAHLKITEMSRPNRQAIRELLDSAWNTAIARIEEQRAEKTRKHTQWLSSCDERIERWTALIDKNEGVIARLEDQISHLEDMASSARTDDFADKVRGWIEEKYEKIRDIRQTNSDLEQKISSLKVRMHG